MRVHKPKKKTTRLLKCEKCYYETNQKQNLNRHILTVHNEKRDSDKSKNRSYPDCGKSFLQQRYLTRHKKIHRKGDEDDIAASLRGLRGSRDLRTLWNTIFFFHIYLARVSRLMSKSFDIL